MAGEEDVVKGENASTMFRTMPIHMMIAVARPNSLSASETIWLVVWDDNSLYVKGEVKDLAKGKRNQSARNLHLQKEQGSRRWS